MKIEHRYYPYCEKSLKKREREAKKVDVITWIKIGERYNQ